MDECPNCERLQGRLEMLQRDMERQMEGHMQDRHEWQQTADERIERIRMLEAENAKLRRVVEELDKCTTIIPTELPSLLPTHGEWQYLIMPSPALDDALEALDGDE